MSAKVVLVMESQSNSANKNNKPEIIAVVDEKSKVSLYPGDSPFEFEVSPGQHQIIFIDGNPHSGIGGIIKKIFIHQFKSGVGLGLGFIGLGGGSSSGFSQGYNAGTSVANSVESQITNAKNKKNTFNFSASNGSTVKIVCKKIKSGKIEAKQVWLYTLIQLYYGF